MINPTRIESVSIRGFRSLADFTISDLPNAAVLIGANGSGKSNFIRFFETVSAMLRPRGLAEFIERQGGADDQLFRGNRTTPRMEAEISLRTDEGRNDYRFALSYGHPDRFFFSEERFRFRSVGRSEEAPWVELESSHQQAAIVHTSHSGLDVNATTASTIVGLLRDCSPFQFHDTSDGSNFKKRWDLEDNNHLHSHSGNLAAILHRLEQEHSQRYEAICRHIGRVLPVFDRFEIEPSYGKVSLRWKAKGTDKTIGAHLTSDGSLRFFALVTLLNLPPEMLPSILLLDEPELGLHPAAVTLIGGMIKSLSAQKQVIVATQSPLLVDAFDLGEIFVLDLEDGRTKVSKPGQSDYQQWLDEYTTGELWQKNLLGGRP